ncbi:hypothetical protein [Bacillus sp. C28GYM-DRY-1]|uniref:hypothetical protein n=1 Tax=Bacillus sp. C28GYM-DRY-1 TaxID=3062686 RepID=UPI002675A114|nr:hypothetical protein [Bacillus sp. C28GYM-DRY-1]MDO3662045.1 hypothetical protein [Bacillus sp. C28GYM-DRY-1]
MNKYNVSRTAVKNATARLGLTKTQAQNVLPKYAQGAAFVWSLESTSGSQAVYDNYNERVRLVIAENGTVLDVFPIDYAIQSPHNLSEEVCQSLKESTKKTLIAKRDETHRKWCEAELAFHENSYEIAKVRLAMIEAKLEEKAKLNKRLANLCAENKRLHIERSELRKERSELERALVPYI